MAQAEANLTTRRGFSKWLAAVGMVAAVPVAANAAPAQTVDWAALETEYLTVLDEIFDVNDRIKDCEKAFRKWERRNPWPAEPDYDSHNARIADFRRLQSAQSKHAERMGQARMQCGVGHQGKQRLALHNRMEAIEQKIASTPAITMSDLKAKARIATNNVSSCIHPALVRDLLNI
jgi:hypothetical protein